MTNLSSSRRANLQEHINVLTWIVGFVILTVIGFIIYNQFATVARSTEALNSTEQLAALDGFDRAIYSLDTIGVIVVVLLILGIGISSYALTSSKTFFLIMFVFAFFLGAISYFLNHLVSQIVYQPALAAAVSHYPKLIMLGTNLHWIALFGIVISVVVVSAKKDEVAYVEEGGFQ